MLLFELFSGNYLYVILLVLTVLYFLVSRVQKRNRRYAPGPKGWPYFGYLRFVRGNQIAIVGELAKLGPVVQFPVGCENVVVLNTLDAIKDAYIKQGNIMTGMPKRFKTAHYILDNKGIGSEEGESWRHQRKVLLNLLKDFGVGKSSLEQKILKECNTLVEEFTKLKQKPFDPLTILGKVSANVISSFVFGRHFGYDDPQFGELLTFMQDLNLSFGKQSYLDYFEFLHLLPDWLTGLKPATNLKTRIMDLARQRIEEHEKKFHKNALKDYMDYCLQDIYERRDNGTLKDTKIEYERLAVNAMNFFGAGSNPTAMVMLWHVKHLLLYPEVTKRIVEEIDSVVGQDRSPSYADRRNTPYFEAFLNEVLRKADVVPIGVPRFNIEEFKVAGYDIPKRSMVFTNFTKVHNDPELWGDPENFRPDRFLDSKTGQLINTENVFLFGVGKRVCPGQSLARMEMYLILSTLLQNFTLQAPGGKTEDFDVIDGTIRFLKPFDIIAVPRRTM